MKLTTKYLVFTISMIVLAIILVVQYKIGKKEGIKKSLYRITYRSVCVIFAFLLAPYINEYILNFDLYELDKSIKYNGLHFYRIIDFLEEVIVHNEVLNDIYNLFPSLKNLLMDFPQVLFIPFTYLLTFLLVSIIFCPLYLFLSYRRKRRVLYDVSYKKSSGVWAGILTAAQSVFLISIILTPINGLMRVYNDSRANLIDEDSNICKENEYLKKYEFACKIIEGYNSSVFSYIGKSPINQYVYDSLTRIQTNNRDTSLNKEMVSIARVGVVLNKTGVLTAINDDTFNDITKLSFNRLTNEDIEIIIQAFEQSLYARDFVYDVYDVAKEYLDYLLQDVLKIDFTINYSYDDIINELKIILRTINYILNNDKLMENINRIYQIISDFNKLPAYKKTDEKGTRLFFDIVYNVNTDYLIELYSLLRNSKIYCDIVPLLIDNAMNPLGFHLNLTNTVSELHEAFYYTVDIIKIIQNHRYIYDVLHLLSELTIDEVHQLAVIFEFLSSSKAGSTFLYDLTNWGLSQLQLKLEIPTELLLEITDFDRELELTSLILQIVYTGINEKYIDFDKAWYALTNYNDTVLFERLFKFAIKVLPEAFKMWILGKDYKYLVGEYV